MKKSILVCLFVIFWLFSQPAEVYAWPFGSFCCSQGNTINLSGSGSILGSGSGSGGTIGNNCGNCNGIWDPSQGPTNQFLDKDGNGILSAGDIVSDSGGSGGFSSDRGGPTINPPSTCSYAQWFEDQTSDRNLGCGGTPPSAPYSQSSYYSQSAYEDTPDIGTSDPTSPRVNLYIQKQGSSGWTKNVQVTQSEEVSLRWVASNVTYCQSKDTTEFSLTNTGGVSGTTDTVNEPETGARTYAIECRNPAGTTVESLAALTILSTPFEFTAAPKLVRTKETSKLTWNVYGRTGCTVANKVNGTDSSTISTSVGSRDTVVLSGETTYLLSCPDGASAEVTIQVLPIISET
jgi:hypothetical protein